MKKQLAIILASALALSLNACGGDDNNNEKQPCTQDVCQDDSVLIECRDGVEHPITCSHGCADNACKGEIFDLPCIYTEPKCSDDGKAVLTCNDGVESSKSCQNGCANGECIKNCDFTGKQCKSDGSAVVTCNDGVETVVEACQYGCDNAACKEACTYTEKKCDTDNKTVLTCDQGKETKQVCDKLCDNGACKDCTEATEKADCGNGKICVEGACVTGCTTSKCENGHLLACIAGRHEAASDANKCDVKCVDDAFGDGLSACVNADYCQKPEECAGREDGKTTCVYSKRTCETFACSKADCKDNETCVLGACVLNTDLEAKYNSACDPKTFVDHCRDKVLYYCQNMNGNEYKVRSMDCMWKGCYAYKDGLEIKSACATGQKHKDVCTTNLTEAKVCEDENLDDYYAASWLTTYSCVSSTNAEEIVITAKIEECDGECFTDSSCSLKK